VIVAHGGLTKESSKITHHDLTEPDDHPPRSGKATAASGSVRRPPPLKGPCAYDSSEPTAIKYGSDREIFAPQVTLKVIEVAGRDGETVVTTKADALTFRGVW
jgi:hypothetical protein